MTAKVLVLAVFPKAYVYASPDKSIFQILDPRDNGRGKLAGYAISGAFSTEESAWQNAAESLPAQVEPHDFIACIECDRSPEHCGLEWCGAPKNHPSHNSHVPVAPVDLCICGLSKSLAKDRLWLHHSSCSLHEPKPTPSTWLKCVYCGRLSEDGEYHEQQCDSPVGYKPQPDSSSIPDEKVWRHLVKRMYDECGSTRADDFIRRVQAGEHDVPSPWAAAKGQSNGR